MSRRRHLIGRGIVEIVHVARRDAAPEPDPEGQVLDVRLDLIEPLLQVRGVATPCWAGSSPFPLEPLDALFQGEPAFGADGGGASDARECGHVAAYVFAISSSSSCPSFDGVRVFSAMRLVVAQQARCQRGLA